MEKLTRRIKALSLKRIEEGQIGFMTTQEDKWYNLMGEPVALQELVKNVVSKGNTIEFEYNNGVVGTVTLVQKAPAEESGSWADDMTRFEDLLNDAHEKGLLSVSTEVIAIDVEKKYALFKAKVRIVDMETGITKECEAHGDATDSNIKGEMIKPHFIRMAETRAVARALRFATNNAKVAVEETQ